LKILLIETSSNIIEFGYAEDNRILTQKRLNEGENADTIIYHIKKEFDENKFNVKEIDVVSISNGPGSFTGIRIGSAISKGICFALNCKLIEVITLDIIANKYRLNNNIRNSEKIIISMIYSNMKTKEYYTGNYNVENNRLIKTKDYQIQKLEELEMRKSIMVANELKEEDKDFGINIVGEVSSIPSQLDLTLDKIKENLFSDPRTSEPFYLKEFIPLTKK
jgi:tRNA threonylcarbamoyladenosine biosynthesis protein TsaB